MREAIRTALTVAIGINISLFTLGAALKSKEFMFIALLSASACLLGLTLPDQNDPK